MNQIKIGEFIASLRKEQNMTQVDLANKLGITDRAVSKWENGRGMPDLPLIKPLCDALSISVNELFCGEKINEEQFTEKAEENIVNTLSFSEKKIRKTKVVSFVVLASVILAVLILVSLFCIDINKMRNNKSVVFSTWGFDYAPPVDLKEEEIEIVIKDYLIEKLDSEPKHNENEKGFASFKIFLLDEIEKNSHYNIYAWVLEQKYYLENDEIKEDSGSSIPYKFVVKYIDNKYIVTDSRIPRDGSLYAEDMKNIFPKNVRKDMEKIHTDGTYERLQLQIDEQTELYFHK